MLIIMVGMIFNIQPIEGYLGSMRSSTPETIVQNDKFEKSNLMHGQEIISRILSLTPEKRIEFLRKSKADKDELFFWLMDSMQDGIPFAHSMLKKSNVSLSNRQVSIAMLELIKDLSFEDRLVF